MRKLIVGTVLSFFLVSFYTPPIALAEDDDKFADEKAREQIQAAGKKIKDLMQKYQKLELDKYNELTITAVDTDGNKPNCDMFVYYNDFKQEKATLKNGYFNGLFNHEKTFPTKVLSTGFEGCSCYVKRIDINGPQYPEITQSVDKVKRIVEDEVGEKISGAASDFAKQQAEKALGHFFEGLGYSGSAMAKRFLGAVGFGAELGAPINDFISKEIDKIFAGVRREAETYYQGTKDQTPLRPRANVIKPRGSWRNLGGLTTPTPFTKYNLNALLWCPKGGTTKLHWQDGRYFKPITAVQPSQPIKPPKPEPKVEDDFDVEEYNRKIEEQRLAREKYAKEQAEREARWAQEKAEREAAAAAAQAKAEAIAKECEKCEKIKQAWQQKLTEYDQAWDDYHNAGDELGRLQREGFDLEKKASQARRALNDFNDPGGDFVASEGNRVDETDRRLRDAAAAEAWDRYQAGELNAQELSDYWGSLDKEAVEALREQVKTQLEAAVKKAEQAQADNKTAQEAQEKRVEETNATIQQKRAEAEQLESAYKDCLKRCREEQAINLLQDYGIKVETDQPSYGWLPWNWGQEATFINATVDTSIINTIPNYTTFTFEDVLVSETSRSDEETEEVAANIHSVIDEISDPSVRVNYQVIGESAQLVNVSTPKPTLADTSGEFQLAVAMQMLFSDTKTKNGEPAAAPQVQIPTRTDADDSIFSADYQALSDLPEVTKVSPGRNSSGVKPSTNFVLTFSEPMDKETVEDNFLIRSFNEETLTADNQDAFDQQTEDAPVGDIWDDSAFDINWNSDSTQAAFTFNQERAVAPPKKKVIIIIIIDRHAKNTGLITNPIDYFNLPNGTLDPSFENAPPVSDSLFVDGFESGNTSAWTPIDPDRGLGSRGTGGFSGDEIEDDPTGEELINALNGGPISVEPILCPSGSEPDAGCSGRCESQQVCKTIASRNDCYTCQTQCGSGQSNQSNCGGACSAQQQCVPTGPGSRCYECLGKPTELLIEPAVKTELKIGEAPIETEEQCVPDCRGKTCGSDGCGGTCGTCNSDAVCNASGQCDAPQCPDGSFIKSQCNNCAEGCRSFPNLENLPCYTCKEERPTTSGLSGGDVFDSGGILIDKGLDDTEFENEPIEEETETFQCPVGSTGDQQSCNSQCSNGACNDNGGGCYSCLQCDSGSFSSQSACEADGSNCEVGGTQGNLSCWVPVASCDDICGQSNMSADPIDFTSQVEAQLNSVSCVSSYSMQINQGTAGDCTCYATQAPTITFDTTPPVCTGTICGDVTCGESASCPTDGGTATVTCNWGGWQKEAQYQYRPLIGGN